MEISFSKYVGSGNDFILIDDRDEKFPCNEKKLIGKLCDRHHGVGADGIILLQRSGIASFRMRIFNADGSEAEMCGNGIRCLSQFAQEIGILGQTFDIETMEQCITVRKNDKSDIMVELNNEFELEKISLPWEGKTLSLYSVKTGVPHVVMMVDNVDKIDLQKLGSFVQHHSHFAPEGTNLNVVQKISDKVVVTRTFERGVGETLACGTGAIASSLAFSREFNSEGPIAVMPRSGEKLIIQFDCYENKFRNVSLTGPAYCSFRGCLNLETYR